jgi:hypothetical protein
LSYFCANRLDMSEIELPIAQTGRAHTEKRNITIEDGMFRVRSGVQSPRGMALGAKLSHLWLDHGASASLHGFDLGGTEVDSDDVMPFVSQAGCRDSADITKSEYANRCAHADTLFSFS